MSIPEEKILRGAFPEMIVTIWRWDGAWYATEHAACSEPSDLTPILESIREWAERSASPVMVTSCRLEAKKPRLTITSTLEIAGALRDRLAEEAAIVAQSFLPVLEAKAKCELLILPAEEENS